MIIRKKGEKLMIGIGNDHHGLLAKKIISNYFNENNIEYKDFGTNDNGNVDYVDYSTELCYSLINGEIEKGILICKTGIGMSIAANKIKGIRCARVLSKDDAFLTRMHNDANVIAIPSNLEKEKIINIVETFINTPFSNEERHQRRKMKIDNL